MCEGMGRPCHVGYGCFWFPYYDDTLRSVYQHVHVMSCEAILSTAGGGHGACWFTPHLAVHGQNTQRGTRFPVYGVPVHSGRQNKPSPLAVDNRVVSAALEVWVY